MQYFRPTEIGDALTWLSENVDAGATVAAGCTDLFPSTTTPALSEPVLDITALAELRGISRSDAGWRFGATTTWTDVVNADLPAAFNGLKQAAREVGSVQIQNVATLAGNLCNASPAADGVPCWLALDAEVELRSSSGMRTLPLDSFLVGPRQTQLSPNEIMAAIVVPGLASQGTSTFQKLGARKYLVISIAMVAARLVSTEGLVKKLAVSIGSCSAVATRLRGVESALEGLRLDDDISDAITDELVATAISPIDDIRGDARYRASVAAQLVRKSVTCLVQAAR